MCVQLHQRSQFLHTHVLFFPQPMRETSKVAVAILYFVHVRILCNMKYPRRMHLDCSVAQQEILGQTARDSADVATQRRTK